MSESTQTTSDGGDPEGLDVEDLFATDDTDISIEDGESDDHTATPGAETTTSVTDDSTGPHDDSTGRPDDSTAEPEDTTAEPEDTTAEALFQQLRDEHDDVDRAHAVADLDESPEEIVARAHEEEAHVDQIDESIRADENALDDLLLTERRKADGFLWVETDGESSTATDDAGGDAADDVESLFAPARDESRSADANANADASASGPSRDTTQLVDDSAAGDVSPDDGFSLQSDEPDSFDARAATFDDDIAFDEEKDDATDGNDDDGSWVDDGDDDGSWVDAGDEDGSWVDAGDEMAEQRSDESTDGAEDDAKDEDDGEDGLAARIRSILTG